MVAHSPLPSSGRRGLPHAAPGSGGGAKSSRGIVMLNAGFGQVSVDEPGHSFPPVMPRERGSSEETMESLGKFAPVSIPG
jgi:hypothetical protein